MPFEEQDKTQEQQTEEIFDEDYHDLLDFVYKQHRKGKIRQEIFIILKYLINKTTQMDQLLVHIMELIPSKYKKQHVREGECPFFSHRDTGMPTHEELAQAKQRMNNLLKK